MIQKRLTAAFLALLSVLVMVLGMSMPVSAEEEEPVKADYENEAGFIDLDVSAGPEDDKNFVVMQDGFVKLTATDSMTIERSEDGTIYTLHNPDEAAQRIVPGTPVAFLDYDEEDPRAYFFVPTRVEDQEGCRVFTSDPQNLDLKKLFKVVLLDIDLSKGVNEHISYNKSGVEFSGDFEGAVALKIYLTLTSVEASLTSNYAMRNVHIKIDEDMMRRVPVAEIPVMGGFGAGVEIGIGLGIKSEGDAEISFDVTGGRIGAGVKGKLLGGVGIEDLNERPTITVNNVEADGALELDLEFGPSADASSLFNLGCDLALGVIVDAKLGGDEKTETDEWHLCKKLSCLQGSIYDEGKVEAYYIWGSKHGSKEFVFSKNKLSDFHYSHTYHEFALEPCSHYLYGVDMEVKSPGSQEPIGNVQISYTPTQDLAGRAAEGVLCGTTDEEGKLRLYLPAEKVTVKAVSWQDDPESSTRGKVHCEVNYTVNKEEYPRNLTIDMPLYHLFEFIVFEENLSDGLKAENMPEPFFVEQDHTGKIPLEVPRAEGKVFLGWSLNKDAKDEKDILLPGAEFGVQKSGLIFYAIWTNDPTKPPFRTITYDYQGASGILPDNPQIYEETNDGFILMNPTRDGYIFEGWTCAEIELYTPEKEVTVEVSGDKSNFVNRTYVAHWKAMPCNVFWYNWDDSLLDVDRDLEEGMVPSYSGPTPQHPSDTSFYIFSGWEPEPAAIVAGKAYVEYTATYTAHPLLILLRSPEDVSVETEEPAVFSVEVSGGEGALTYQWYVIPAGTEGDPNSGAGSAIDGANTDTLTLTARKDMDGNRYYCVVKDDIGQQVISKAAVLHIAPPSLVLVTSPDNLSRKVGEQATFKVAVAGGVLPYHYQWYQIPAGTEGDPASGAGSAVSGANTDTLTFTVERAMDGNRYYCVVWDAVEQRVVSGAGTLYIPKSGLMLVSSPADAVLPAGQTANFTVEVTGGERPYHYQWYRIPAGAGSDPASGAGSAISGANAKKLSVVADLSVSDSHYYCVVEDAQGEKVTSGAALLQVITGVAAGSIPETGDDFPWQCMLVLLSGSGALLLAGVRARSAGGAHKKRR